MGLKIEKGTYGSYERPCIYFTDTQTHYTEYAEYAYLNEYGKEIIQKICGQIEYCIKHNIPIEVEGFRTDKNLYPDG